MKWINHKLVTGCAVMLATGDLIATGIAAAGAIIPDFVEGRPPEEDSPRYAAWRRSHRQLSHWFVLYASIAAFAHLYLKHHGIGFSYPLEHLTLATSADTYSLPIFEQSAAVIGAYLALFGACGALLHIAEDSITGTVPSLIYTKRTGIRLFSVGSLPEYLLAVSLLGYTITRFLS